MKKLHAANREAEMAELEMLKVHPKTLTKPTSAEPLIN
jgi:hypothetical protein